eukprot:3831011-Pleurochrysis_carterae.AAC.1
MRANCATGPNVFGNNARYLSYTDKHGLALSFDGKVFERSLFECANKLVKRDRELMTDPARSLWLLTFGVDATARSTATLSELKALTLAIAQQKDDGLGLPKMLHAKISADGKNGRGITCLAAEIEQLLYDSPLLELWDGSSVRCGIRACLDLAAVRGMRGLRGKGAALCGC